MNNNTEQLGILAVSGVLALVPTLGPHLDENDRTLLTDGHIDLFSDDKRQKVKTLLGRVYPQVKTSDYPKKSAIPRTFSIAREHLVGYRSLQGVLFFHVGLVGNKRKATIKYVNLNPGTIDKLLAGMSEGQKFLSVRLKDFPSERAAVERIVRFQWETQAESGVLGFDPALLTKVTSFTIYSDELVHIDRPISFDDPERTYSLQLTTRDGMSLHLPAHFQWTVTPSNYLEHPVEIEITSGEVTFTRGIRKQLTPSTFEIRLSPGLLLTFTMASEGLRLNVGLEVQADLLNRLNDLEFCAALEVSGRLTLHGTELTVREPESKPELPGELAVYKKIHRTLEALGADLSLVSLTDMKNSEYDSLLTIHDVLFEGKPLPEQYQGTLRIRQDVGEWALDLLVRPDDEGGWVLGSFVQMQKAYQLPANYENEDRYFLATPYDVLGDDILSSTLNLDLDQATAYYDRIRTLPDTVDLARNTVLRFIRAADLEPRRREAFLGAAGDLSRWLLETQPSEPRIVLNAMQVRARLDEITDDDRTTLRAMRRAAIKVSDEDSIEIAAACSIILGDLAEAHELLATLDVERQEEFNQWPIGALLAQNDSKSTPPRDDTSAD